MDNNLEVILANSRKSYVLTKLRNFVLGGALTLGALSYNGCASGENPSTNSPLGCVKDNECKGGRICISGECVYPPEKDTYTPIVYEDTTSYVDTSSSYDDINNSYKDTYNYVDNKSSNYDTAKEEVFTPKDVYQSKDVNQPKDVSKPEEEVVAPKEVYVPPSCVDNDNDGYGVNCSLGSDCDDNNNATHKKINCDYDGYSCGNFNLCLESCPTLSQEICDGKDNNCNGQVDEDAVCIDCKKYNSYFLVKDVSFIGDAHCCTEGEKGDLMCIIDSFDSGNLIPYLAWAGNKLWIGNNQEKKIDLFDEKGKLISKVDASFIKSYISGLAWDGQSIWVADRDDEKIYQLSSSGNKISSFNIPEIEPHGMEWVDSLGNLLVVNGWDKKIYSISTNGSIGNSFNAPGASPKGLAWNGKKLWNVDLNDKKIYKINALGDKENTFNSPTTLPQDLTWDGTYFWHTDVGGKVYKILYVDVN